MSTQEAELINELNVYTGLDSFNSSAVEKELEECAKHGADANKLKALGFNALQLSEIRKGYEDPKVDPTKYMNPKMSWTDMEEMRIEMSQNIDMSQYRAQGFDAMQLYQIRKGISEGVDVSVYAKKEYLADQMKQLRLGLSKKGGVPIIFFQDPMFDSLQMREIRKGLEAGIDISNYARLDMPYMKMRAVRESAEDGLFFSTYDISNYTAGVINQLHLAYLDKVDIMSYVKKRYDEEQLEQIRLAIKSNLPLSDYITPDMRGEAIKEIRLGLESGVDVRVYADVAYGWQQMFEIRTGLEHQIDVTPYCKPLYMADQMREIRRGIEDGMDITKFSSMMYTAKDMRRIRKRMLAGDTKTLLADDSLDGSVLDRTGGVSDSTALLLEILENKEMYMEISPDGMQCYFKLPIRGDGAEYTEDIIMTALFKSNVRKGINREEIKKMLASPKAGQQHLVASGQQPQDGRNGYYDFMYDLSNTFEPEFLEDGSADFSKFDFINRVNVGDKIAVYNRATKGVDGFNVKGEVIPAKNGKEIPILKGDGFMILSDRVTYVAKVTGALSYVNEQISIKKILMLEEVKITDKKIVYDGVIMVKGDVNAGSDIEASGDILIGGHLESSEIVSGGNVIIAGGATCQNKGTITAKGNVTAKFFEGVIIKARDVAANYFINCSVEAGGHIRTFGKNGVIYGGSIQSLGGITSAQIGNKSGAKTIINLGATTELLAELNKLQKTISRETEELKTLAIERERLKELGSVDRQLMQWKIKINAAVSSKQITIKKMLLEKEKLDQEIQKGSNARAEITEMCFAGVVFVIDGIVLKITEDRKVYGSLVYRTDAKKENIVADT